jgi:hypothetical protein
MVPSVTLWSEWQRPAALMATRTSPAPGVRTSTFSMATALAAAAIGPLPSMPWLPIGARGRAVARELAVLDDRLAVDEHAHDPFRTDLPALLAAREIGREVFLAELQARGIEQHDVGMVAACEQPAQRMPHTMAG